MTLAAVITGIGLVTPAGISTDSSWKAVCAGISAAATDSRLAGLPVDLSCAVPGSFDPAAIFGPAARRLDPFTQFAVAAAREAVADAGLVPANWDSARVGVVIGNGFGGMQVWAEQLGRLAGAGPGVVSPLTIPMAISNIVASQIAIDLAIFGPSLAVSTACASGTTAIGLALDLLRSRRCDLVIAGGTEAGITPITAAAFDRLQTLSHRKDKPAAASCPFDQSRDGFVLGEGAGVVVLERESHAQARSVRPYARLLGYGASTDAHHLTKPHPDGAGARIALDIALRDSGVTIAEVSHINAHAASTPVGDFIEARLIQNIFGTGTVVTSTKGVTGHLLGAAGAVEVAFTALAIKHSLIPPTANFRVPDADIELDIVKDSARSVPVPVAVSQSFGFGGHNAVVVLGQA